MTEAASRPVEPPAAGVSLLVARAVEAAPALIAVGVFVWWTAAEGGFALTRSYPGALLILGALLALVSARARDIAAAPVLVLASVASAGLLGLVAVLSVFWADVPGDAWDGGNRTLVYAACFALFALSRLRSWSLAALLGLWACGVAAVGVATVASAATDGDLDQIFVENRLSQPIGYSNATCALFVMAFWPALVLASRRQMPVAARAVLFGIAFALIDLALLTQSRASLVAVPLTAIVAFALVPGRVRLLLTLAPIALAVALTLDPMLDVYQALDDDVGRDAAGRALRAIALGFGGMVVAGVLFALADRRLRVAPRIARRAELAFVTGAVTLGLAAAIGAVVAAEDPVGRVDEAWEEFNSGYPETFEGSHFSGGLGDYRSDLWRVALRQFRDEPILGVGTDNFGPAYIKERRFDVEPRFPHSVELAVLNSTGVVGTALFLALVGCAAAVYLRTRARELAPGAVGTAAVLVFVHWFAHGSIDWFWEIPALGAPAFAFLGAAVSAGGHREPAGVPTRRRVYVVGTVIAVAAVAVAVAATPPWLAERQTQAATAGWRADPARSIDELERAARLNRLSARPFLLAGTIANRTGRHAEARSLLLRSLERSEVNWYAKLELAVAEAALGDRTAALATLGEAARLNPRETVITQVREWVASGEEVDLEAIDYVFLDRLASRMGREGPDE